MRFMMLMHPNIEPGDYLPSVEAVAAMNSFNEDLTQAGALLAADGLHPMTTGGARITYPGGKATVTDGPYAESKELIGGYWIIDVASKEEAVEWAKRIPGGGDVFVDVRRIFELSDMPQEIQDVAGLSSEPPEQTKARS